MIFGCDYGSRRIALFDLEKCRGYVLRLPKLALNQAKNEDRGAALSEMSDWIFSVVPPLAVLWCESPIGGQRSPNLSVAIKMAQTTGAIAGRHWPTYFVHQATWKKEVVGHGHAEKAFIASWLAAHHPEISTACGKDQDLIDAACIALHGSAVAARGLEGTGALSPS